jgi:hypothetical protein
MAEAAVIVDYASCSALAVTINTIYWQHEHPIAFLATTTSIADNCFLCKSEYYFTPAIESPSGYNKPFF